MPPRCDRLAQTDVTDAHPDDDVCPSCGAPARGRVCHVCGSLVRRVESPEAEAEALAELHVAAAAADDPTRARLLGNAVLPDDRDVLLDAALRCVQLLSAKEYADKTPHAAVRRIEAVCAKLRILAPGDDIARRGVAELEAKLVAFRREVAIEETAGNRIVAGILLFVVALIGGIAWVATR